VVIEEVDFLYSITLVQSLVIISLYFQLSQDVEDFSLQQKSINLNFSFSNIHLHLPAYPIATSWAAILIISFIKYVDRLTIYRLSNIYKNENKILRYIHTFFKIIT
jgi:hypothetical protein